jgi:hypothetical protein
MQDGLFFMKNFTRERVRKYGLQSQKFVTQQKAEELLKSKGFVLTNHNKNCLFTNGGKESMKHWVVKAMIFKILREMGKPVGSEVEVDGGIVDVIDLDDMIVYEVERKMRQHFYETNTPRRIKDIFVIILDQVPGNINEAEKYLRERIV